MNSKVVFGTVAALLFLSSRSKANTAGGGGYSGSGNGFIPNVGAEGTVNESYLGGNYPRGVRNNNPGNIKYDSSNPWQGKIPAAQNTEERRVDGTPIFEQFVSWAYGVRAMIHILKNSYIPSGRNTLRVIMQNWAPDGGTSYLNYMVGKVGKGADTVISSNDEATIKKIVQAIARFENNRKYNVQEVITDAQYTTARGLL